MYSNFGEICSNIKELMEEFQRYSRNQAKVESISDMKVIMLFSNCELKKIFYISIRCKTCLINILN